MNILHINIRLSEGGAAQVARALHNHLIEKKHTSNFIYGYGNKINKSAEETSTINSYMLGTKLQVLQNFALHRVIGIDLIKPNKQQNEKLDALLVKSDIVHLHAIHSYYIPYEYIFDKIIKYKKQVVWTAHDRWAITGRCAITDKCEKWMTGCGACPYRNNYPPTIIDISKTERVKKISSIEKINDYLTIVSPSNHVLNDIKIALPNTKTITIENSISPDFEKVLNSRGVRKNKILGTDLPTLLIIANDLSSQSKTNHTLIKKILQRKLAKIITIGKNSPFYGELVTNKGELKDKNQIVDLYIASDAMLFTSRIDNYPIVICEALCAGTPVLATASDAAYEILSKINSTPFTDEDILMETIATKTFFSNYISIKTNSSLMEKSIALFGIKNMADNYITLYESLKK